MSAHEMLQPDQFGKLRFADFPGGTIDEVADHLYSHEPQFMSKLERSIRRNGVREPVEMARGDKLVGGHHRIAAAYRAGQPVPYVNGPRYRADMTPQGRANEHRWRQIRRDIPEDYDARMAHDPRNWRNQ